MLGDPRICANPEHYPAGGYARCRRTGRMLGMSDDYWAVDVPGMTEEQAEATVRWLSREHGLTGIIADPAEWMSLHLDVSTVSVLADALARYPGGNGVAAGMLESFQEWLAATRPEDRA
jgi:hypothetical protein